MRRTIIRRWWSDLKEFLGLCSLHMLGVGGVGGVKSSPGGHNVLAGSGASDGFYAERRPRAELREIKG